MRYNRKVIAKVDCPRCNAVAELRPEQTEFEMFFVYLTCPKCKLRKFVGVSSWQIYRNNSLIEKLRYWLEKTDDELVSASIRAKIQKLEETTRMKEIGL